MRAVLLDGTGGAEVLRMGEAERPVIHSGQVLIKVAASSVNRADINQRQGNYPRHRANQKYLGLKSPGQSRNLAHRSRVGTLAIE